MKKFLMKIFLFSLALLLIVAPALGETSLNLQYATGGTNNQNDITGGILGLFSTLDRWNLGLDYGSGRLQNDFNTSNKFELIEGLVGYNIWDGEHFKFGPTLSYLDLTTGNYSTNGLLAGLQASYRFSPAWAIRGAMGYAINPSARAANTKLDDAFLRDYALGINWDFSKSWSMLLGGRYYRYSGDIPGVGDRLLTQDKLYTLGLGYKFGAPTPTPVATPAPTVQPTPVPTAKPTVAPTPVPTVKPTEQPKPTSTATPKPTPQPTEQPKQKVQRLNEYLKPVFFEFDKATIPADQLPVLQKDLELLQSEPSLYILIGGHADAPGTSQYNMNLSQRRAETVRTWLINHGVNPNRITIAAYGKEYPYLAKATEPGWKSDRWVDIVVSENPISREQGIRK